ncbi:MAG: methyltransferase, partial [Pseudomonadota bacterium]
MLPILSDSAPSLFFNVPYTERAVSRETVDIVHFMKPGFDEWERKGYQSQKCIPENAFYDRIYYWGEKSAQASRFYLARLLTRLNDGGYLIAAAKNDENGKRYQKWFEEFGLQPQNISKKKTRIVFAKKELVKIDVINQAIEESSDYKITYNSVEFKTHPGIFSAQKIDQGSILLIENLSDELKGVG